MTRLRAYSSLSRDAGYHLFLRLCNALLRLPGHRLRVGVMRHVGRCVVGSDTVIERGVVVSGKGGVQIGSGCNINRGVLLDGRGGLTIGDTVNISPEVM